MVSNHITWVSVPFFIIHMVMAEINDNKFIASCEELRAWVEEHHHFLGISITRCTTRLSILERINQGALEDWKKQMFLEIAAMRSTEDTGGRRKVIPSNNIE